MGFDVTLHPFKRKEFKYFIEDVVEQPQLIDSRVAAIHHKEEERAFLASSIYERISHFKTDVLEETAHVEKTIGLATAGILGYLQPYWYLRNGLLSKLMTSTVFASFTANLSSIVAESQKPFFDSESGVIENFSSGVYLPFDNIEKLKTELADVEFKTLVTETIGSENIEVLKNCLDYCISNELDLLEATDLCVPFTGESSTFAPNMKAIHLKNISDFKNYSEKRKVENYEGAAAINTIDKTWWNNLNQTWRESIRIAYQVQVTPNFETYSLRNDHVAAKFAEETLDLSGIEDVTSINVQILSRENHPSTLAPLLNLPKVKALGLRSFSGHPFDLKRVLAFRELDELHLCNLSVQHFLSLQELEHLSYLDIESIGVKASVLKKVALFPSLKSMFLSTYRSVSFLQGNEQIEALTVGYTKGLKNLPNLKRLNLFPKEASPKIIDCPNIEFINCCYARRMTNLSSFTHLEKLKTLAIRSSGTAVDLGLLVEMPTIENFFVDDRTRLETIPTPIKNVNCIYVLNKKEIDEPTNALIKEKFPNAEIHKFKHPGYK